MDDRQPELIGQTDKPFGLFGGLGFPRPAQEAGVARQNRHWPPFQTGQRGNRGAAPQAADLEQAAGIEHRI